MLLSAFTAFHVALSLIGIGAGFFVLYGLLTSKRSDGWNSLFLISTAATTITGFLFPFTGFLPSHAVGVLSLAVLTIAIIARYRRSLAGSWRWIYVVTAMLALYFNVFVLIVQLFEKVPSLVLMAPTQSEPPFVATQLTVLVLFVILSAVAVVRFRNTSPQTT
jgi:hypothetical protein